jgi:hypothetical protein
MRLLSVVILTGLCSLTARAEDWTTTDGKTYQAVKIIKVEDDAVTILYRDGGARVSLALLPPTLQAEFHYDPAKAKVAAEKHDEEQKEAETEMMREREIEAQTDQKRQAAPGTFDPATGLPVLPPLPAPASGNSDAPDMRNTSSPSDTATELGRYKAKVYRVVGARWYPKVNKQLQLLSVGMVKIQYTIYSDGTVQLKVLAGAGLPLLLALCENAIIESAPFDPFTDSMRKQVGDSFTDEFTFTVSPPDN